MDSNFRNGADYNDCALSKCACCGAWKSFMFIANACSINCAEKLGIDWQAPFRAAGKEHENMLLERKQRMAK